MAINLEWVLAFSRELQQASTLTELCAATQRAVVRATRYRSSWICGYEAGPGGDWVRVLGFQGAQQEIIWEEMPRFPVGADAMLLEIRGGGHPVVVEDMRTDPRSDKALVAKAGHRTCINVPLQLGSTNVGALGVATFGDEGVMPPTPEELEHLTVYGALLAAALDRVRLVDEQHRARAAAEALRQQHRELETQLRQAQKLEALGTLAGGIAHDFNNVLTAIIAHADIAAFELPPGSPAAQSLEVIVSSAQRAAQLTRDLLTFGRKQVVHFRPVRLRQLVPQVERLLRPLLRENVTLSLDLSAEELVVNADEAALEQVLMNLVTNARDAMPDGGTVTVRVEPFVIDDDFVLAHGSGLLGTCALLTVSDTGVGMDAATAARVFEPFFTTKPVGRGTGLGLSTVHSLVAQHGGLVLVDSAPGRGTAFRVYLPTTGAAVAQVHSSSERPRRGVETVLVAEDDEVVRDLVVRLLEGQGYQVWAAADGAEAIDRFRAESQRVDLVLSDVVMPQRSGLELARAVRAFHQDTPVLLVSGYVGDGYDPAELEREGIPLLMKPVRPTLLLETVRRLLDARPRPRSA